MKRKKEEECVRAAVHARTHFVVLCVCECVHNNRLSLFTSVFDVHMHTLTFSPAGCWKALRDAVGEQKSFKSSPYLTFFSLCFNQMFHCVLLTAPMYLLSTCLRQHVRYDWAVLYNAAHTFSFFFTPPCDICSERVEKEPQEQHLYGVFPTLSLTWQAEKLWTSDCFLRPPVSPKVVKSWQPVLSFLETDASQHP